MTRNLMFLRYMFFVKFLIYAYWADNVTVLTISVSLLFTVFTISLNFQNMHIFFFIRFFVITFYHVVCNIFNIRLNLQLIKLQLLKCISFEKQLLHFHNVFPWNEVKNQKLQTFIFNMWYYT